jgi:hypothetical protein
MVSQQLVEQWRVRLAAAQLRLDEGRPRPWLARAYVRVFKFLLSQYGSSGSEMGAIGTRLSETLPDAETAHDRSAMRFEAVRPELAGKPPRRREAIRSVLEAVQARVPHAEQGPLSGGLRPGDPIVVASFYHPGLAAGLRELLKGHGIETQSKRFRRQTQVIICARDLEHSKPIVAAHAAVAKDSSRWRVQYAEIISTVATFLGVLAGLTFAAAFVPPPYSVFVGIIFGGTFGFVMYSVGSIIGALVDN